MPVVLTAGRFKFCIYFKDHNPPHVHVMAGNAECVINLLTREVMAVRIFTKRDVNHIQRILVDHYEKFLELWNDYQN